MASKQTAPYGSWPSPLSAELVASSARSLRNTPLLVASGWLYWIENRPSEQGRSVLMRCSLDAEQPLAEDVTPAPFSVRTRVHEYGGGAYTVDDQTIYFVNLADQQIYRQSPDAPPTPITSEQGLRYADLIVDRERARLICVCEDHRQAGHEPINTLVALALDGSGQLQQLVGGNDFYATPRLSPDGRSLAWLSWNHPNMPWDGTELWLGTLGPDGLISSAEQMAGGSDESIFQPHWSPDGVLFFVSDRSGWWNLYRWQQGRALAVLPMAAEFGLPQWMLGSATYSFASATQLICAVQQQGRSQLASIDLARGELSWLDTPYTEIGQPCAADGSVAFLGGSPREGLALVRIDLAGGALTVLRRSQTLTIEPEFVSVPEPISFPTEDGQTAYGFFYPPQHRDLRGPDGERPPLLLISHGGPTGATTTTLSLAIQLWTSRGFAVLDVDYGGSTGYGRAYRLRLNGQWGVVDVADCVGGARYLVQRGDVDGRRLAIRGGSAGGYTTICALVFHDLFSAGASHFGISDLELLAGETHKFESRYLERLVGPYPAARELYRQRSPIHFSERLSCPLILLQGAEDKVVPPNQAELLRDALRAKRLPVAYLLFEGEGHGFRNAANIVRALEAELSFYAQVFGFTLSDPITPVQVENLEHWQQRAG